MKFVFTICILFIQLLGYCTAEAGKPVQLTDEPRQENAALSAFSFHQDPSAKPARPIQFHYTTFQIRDQRFPDGLLSVNILSSYLDELPIKHANVYPATRWLPLVRLLLFPKHYFW